MFSGSLVSGTSLYASFSSSPDIGRRIRVQAMLKIECAVAMPAYVAGAFSIVGANKTFTTEKIPRQTTVPITLKDKCTRAALLAFFVVPTEERIAVMQVPIFCPIIIGMAAP